MSHHKKRAKVLVSISPLFHTMKFVWAEGRSFLHSSSTSQPNIMSGPTQRTSIELYRDLLRLIHHIAPGSSPKSLALRTLVRSEFDKSKSLSPSSPSDAVQIEALKANAVRALSNYMLYEGGIQDKRKGGKLGAAMDTYHERSLEGIQQNKKDERRRPGGNNKTET